ncbi:MAG: hypothetical protein J4G17_00785 [Anaerolineae bacterium]|nr:hypothetical protein [Anaerolineae bacterium]
MSEVQIFHATLDGARELEATPFGSEKELQGLFERHLRDLTGIDFVKSEHRTGSRHKRRADTLGLDSQQRPVVIEYKLGHGGAAISQGLDYLFWLQDHKGDFRELVRDRLGTDRSRKIDFKHARLLCVAGEFRREDIINAETNTRRIELLCVRRHGESTTLLKWVVAGEEARKPDPVPSDPNGKLGFEKFEKYKYWKQLKANPELYRLFEALCEHANSLGDDVLVNLTKHYISIRRQRTAAYIKAQAGNNRLIVYVYADLKSTSLHEGFTRVLPESFRNPPCNLEISIRNHEDLERAKPLIKRSYEEAG